MCGKFKGRKLSELADEELKYFLRVDAQLQTGTVFSFLDLSSMPYMDRSQYWFAKFELERRKPESQRKPSVEITASDTPANVALKLLDYGFRIASQKYHPDRGGDTATMQRLSEARQLARQRLKT